VVLKIDPHNTYIKKIDPPNIFQPLHLINNDCSLSFALLVLKKVGMKLNGTNVLYARSLPLSYLLICEMLVKIAS
jgi:hypothetical protein